MAITNTHQKIDIIIHADIVQKKANTANATNVNPHSKTKSDEENLTGNPSQMSTKRKLHMANNLARNAVNLTMSFTNMRINQIANMSGDNNYQETVSRQFEVVEDASRFAINVATSTINGAMRYGIPGAIIYFAVSALSQSLSYSQKYEGRNINNAITQWKETQNINYNKARAGVDLTDGRSRLR